mmetsp:Transcript_20782/g.59288  ORF Transcript_20782/g.59288 Transcript_20782/m.59288 type:complete len:86 (-) Transcript_20782:245-502(-)
MPSGCTYLFRKHTQRRAAELGLVGWVRNAEHGSVQGEAQGARDAIEAMKIWLRTKGSPKSRIDRCDIIDMPPTQQLSFDAFEVVK